MAINRINFQFSPKQEQIIHCQNKRIVLTTGRRFGKSYTCRRWAQKLLFQGRYADGFDLIDSPVLYVAPTLGKAEKYMWRPMVRELEEIGALREARKKKLEIELINGRQLWLASADNPDSLRGDSLAGLIIDETKDIKKEAIEESVLPALMDKDGPALFVGSPKKGTYFEELYRKGRSTKPEDADWISFEGTTYDNPSVPRDSIHRFKRSVPEHVFLQEVMGKFVNAGSDFFGPDSWQILDADDFDKRVSNLRTYIAIDLAGFTEDKTGQRDNHAIAVVHPGEEGWFVRDVITGTWNPHDTALRINMAFATYRPLKIGCESGALKYAVNKPVSDMARKDGLYYEFQDLYHGGKNKMDRIAMELLVRATQKRLFMRKGAFNEGVLEESEDFPNPLCKNDRLDAIAYIGQLAQTAYAGDFDAMMDQFNDYEPLDESGY